MKGKFFFFVFVCALGAAGYYGYQFLQQKKAVKPMMMPMAVNVQVANAKKEDVPNVISALGTVSASETVNVTSRIQGHLTRIGFTEGGYVKKGQLLAQLDTRTYQANYDQYAGSLKQVQAQLKNANALLTRYTQLAKKGSISVQELETQKALVSQYEGAVKAAKGQMESARLNIEYGSITAPIDGYVGLKGYDIGNLIQANAATPIVTIAQMKPAIVTFSIPESYAADIAKRVRNGETLLVKALDQKTLKSLDEGKVVAVDNQINTATGTVKVKAQFENAEEKMFANQAISIRLTAEILKDSITIPESAVQTASTGNYVFKVNKDMTVRKVPVKLGLPHENDRVAILRGVSEGDLVVTAGVSSLAQDMKVNIVKSQDIDMSVLDRPRKRHRQASMQGQGRGAGLGAGAK